LAYFLFIDESGQDRRESPYEVLAGVAIEDRDLWNLVQTIQEAEIRLFGGRYSGGSRELKAKKLLKRKVFRHAGQMDGYFKRTAKGKARARQIIPEPFFVHSELTTGVQIADLVAYTISWGFRLKGMTEPRREELAELVNRVSEMRYRAVREVADNADFSIWSFSLIDDLRARDRELQ